MERCGFFDANLVGEEYDRVYLASQFAAYFASFIGNGVFAEHSNQLQVVEMATPQMQVGVERGQAWINGYWYENTDILYLPIDVADGVLNRIDSVVLRLGFSERNIWLTVKKGTPAVNPVAPEVTRNADYYELQLATISIPAGSIKITQAQITDTRMNKDVCGWVTGVVDQVDTTTLFNQYVDWYTTTTGQAEADIETITQQFQDNLTQFEQNWNNWFSQQQTEGFIMAVEKGQPNGIATLDENGKVLAEQLPEIEVPVTSVNGQTGDVELDATDVGAASKEDFESHKNDKVAHIDYAVASGTNAYTANIQGITALVEGLSVKIKFQNANTGTSTLSINGLDAKPIQKSNGAALSGGNIKAGQICHLVYTGSVFQLLGEGGEYGTAQPEHVLQGYTIGTEQGIVTGTMPDLSGQTLDNGSSNNVLSPDGFGNNASGYYGFIKFTSIWNGFINTTSAFRQLCYGLNPAVIKSGHRIGKSDSNLVGTFTSDATASADSIFSGKTAYANGVKLTGTMPDNGTKIITPSTVNQAIPAGYHSGSGYVQGSVNLKPENIKSGVNIFNVIGTLKPITDEKKIVTGTGTFSTGGGSFTHYIPLTSLSITPEGFFVYLDGIQHSYNHRDYPDATYIGATIKESGVWKTYYIEEAFEYSTYGIKTHYYIAVTYEENNQRLKIRGDGGFKNSNVSFKWWAFGN